MGKDDTGQHEAKIEVEFEYGLFWLLLQSTLLLLDIRLFSISSTGYVYPVTLFIIVVHFFEGFAVPVAKFDDSGNGCDNNEEIDKED
jgi:hypothetical protein